MVIAALTIAASGARRRGGVPRGASGTTVVELHCTVAVSDLDSVVVAGASIYIVRVRHAEGAATCEDTHVAVTRTIATSLVHEQSTRYASWTTTQ